MKLALRKRVTEMMVAAVLAISCCISVCAAAVDTGFSDVPTNAWYADAVEYVKDNGLMSGTTATIFAPDTTASRAMLVTILYRRAGSPSIQASGEFHDVTTDAIGAEGPAGTLAYFAPWGDVVMCYSSYGPYSGLDELGFAVSGGEHIENLRGTLQITKVLE